MKKIFGIFSILAILLILAVGCSSEQEVEKKKSDYLVLLYLSGDSNNGDNFYPTLQQAEDALYEIRNDDGSAKKGYATVNVVALWDGPNERYEYVHSDSKTRLLELGPGYHDFNDFTNDGLYGDDKLDWSLSSETIDFSSSVDWIIKNGKQEVNMGSEKTLTNFLKWTKDNYEAENVILLFGDHGSGPSPEEEQNSRALMFDDDTNNDSESSFLTTSKIRNSLINSGYCGNDKIDLIIEDVCFQSSIDEAYGLCGYADYFLASENTTIENGLGCYHLIKDMRRNTPILTIAKDQVLYFKNKWALYEFLVTQTFALIDLTKKDVFERLKTNTSKLAQKIEALGVDTYTNILSDIRSYQNLDYGFLCETTYVKVRDFGLLVSNLGSSYPALSETTDIILQDLQSVIIKSFVSGFNQSQDFTFEFDVSENQIYGLSISVQRTGADTSYNTWTLFGKDNKWSDLIIDPQFD